MTVHSTLLSSYGGNLTTVDSFDFRFSFSRLHSTLGLVSVSVM